MTRWLWILALTGCVSKTKFDELQAELDTARVQYADTLASRDATILGLRTDVSDLGGQIAKLKKQLEDGEASLDAMRSNAAAALKDKAGLKAEVDQMRLALQELERRKAAADARLAEFRDLLKRFKTLIDAGTLQVKIKDGRMLVELATDVLFASGSANLSADGKTALSQVSTILASIPEREFQVEGHTDDDAISTAQFPNNWFLASRRALNVVDHMLDAGMPPARISAASFGEYRPAVPNDTPEQKAQNRRIQIVVIPDLEDLPGYAELEREMSK